MNKFHIQLYEFIKRNGERYITMPQLAALMDDEGLFRTFANKPYKLLFRFMVSEGYVNQFYNMGEWKDDEAEKLEQEIESRFYGNADIHYALQSIAYSLGWIAEVDDYDDSSIDICQNFGLEEEAVEYIAHGSKKCIGTLIPSAMALPVHHQLNVIAHEEGSVADFVMAEMQITTKKELEEKISGEQIDGVAMAIRQMRNGRGFIIGDMTGIGKGRQLAMLLKWATLQANRPVFVTEKSVLFNDLFRDLFDVGYGDLRPFILNTDKEAKITDANGNVIYNLPDEMEMNEFRDTKKLPAGYDFLLLTYSQLSRERTKNWKADSVMNAIDGSFLLMDESHNASGEESNVGEFFREAVQKSCGVCFASATYAKYPSSMPIYAMKTAMGEADVSSAQLIDIISHGGPILQEVMAKGLVASGSMIRRQRDMKDVQRSLYTSDNVKDIAALQARYDKVIDLISDIHDFQDEFITPYLNSLSAEQLVCKKHKVSKNEVFIRKKTHISYMRFSLRMTPTIRQLLFSIKTEDAIQATLAELKAGHKPILQINRTMESCYTNLVQPGVALPNAEFSLSLLNCLKDMFKYKALAATKKGKTVKYYEVEQTFDMKDLKNFFNNDEVKEAYDYLVKKINNTHTDLPLSPIDYFVQRLENEGYKVGEMTQRKLSLIYEKIKDGATGKTHAFMRKKINKKRLASDFNNGALDVLIGNRVMSSGISLHCSDAFKDKRKRTVITWEHQDSADRQTQFDGRADRTGQLQHCDFITLSSAIPAEQRFLMMNERKLRSLNANVEANQHADDAGFDMLNKYGSKVAKEYLHENPEKEAYFADDEENYLKKADDQTAFITRFMRTLGLLKCDEQREILDDVMHRYTELINYLDEIGENDLKPNVLPLNATLLNRSVFRNGKRNSASVFGNDAMLDEVEVDVLSRPLTSIQIKAILPTLTSTDVLVKQLKTHCKQKADNIKAYYTQLQNDATQQLNLLRSSGAHYTPSHVAQLEERANNTDMMNAQIEKVETQTGLLCQLIKTFMNGQAVGIPMALVAEGEIEDNRLVDYVSVGLFLGFKVVGSKTTRSSIKAVFVVNDGRCRLDIPLTEEGKLMTIHNQTNLGVMRQRLSKVTIDTWDSLLSNSTRERAYIVTGNLLSGIAFAKQFGKNVGNRKLRQIAMNKGRGHLITYTDDMGRVKNGYMLSRMFRPTDLQLYAPKP